MIKVTESNFSKIPPLFAQVGTSTVITSGDLLYEDTTNAVVKPATSAAGSTLNLFGVATKSVTTTSGTSTVKAIPLNRNVYVIADCTNTTAANQLHKDHAMTDAATVNNTASTVASTLGVFHALALVGSASNKKLFGYFNVIGQVTA